MLCIKLKKFYWLLCRTFPNILWDCVRKICTSIRVLKYLTVGESTNLSFNRKFTVVAQEQMFSWWHKKSTDSQILLCYTFYPLSPSHRSYICVQLTDGTARIFIVILLFQLSCTSNLFPGLLQAILRENACDRGTRKDRSANYFSELRKSLVMLGF